MIRDIRKTQGISIAYEILNQRQAKYHKYRSIETSTIFSVNWGETGIIIYEDRNLFLHKSVRASDLIREQYRILLLVLLRYITKKDTVLFINMSVQWINEMFLTEEFGDKFNQEISDIEEVRFLLALNNTKVIFQYEDTKPSFVKRSVEILKKLGFPLKRLPRVRLSSLTKAFPSNASNIKDYRCLKPEKKISLQSFLRRCSEQQERNNSNLKR